MKIYLSPSNQRNNKYNNQNTTEAEQMIKIANKVKSLLSDYVCEVKIAAESLTIDKPGRPTEAKNWGTDIYLCIHSNAGGGIGTECFFDPTQPRSINLAKELVSKIESISPLKSTRSNPVCSGLTQFNGWGYGEIRNPKALGVCSCYLEVNFHDNKTIASWIVNNNNDIAQKIVDALVKVFIIKKKVTLPPVSNVKFKVNDIVRIKSSSFYYNTTKLIPGWVIDEEWIIKEISGTRAVLNYNEDKTLSIMSPVSTSDLIPVERKNKTPYLVKLLNNKVPIYSGIGATNTITDYIKDKGVYTIVEVKDGWGKLKSGAGWIKLSDAKEV